MILLKRNENKKEKRLDQCNLYSEIKYERKEKEEEEMDRVHIGKENGNVTN